jgi:oligoribonuclease (3'-5' exoribonuclease)
MSPEWRMRHALSEGGRGGLDVGSALVADSTGHLVWIDCEMTGLDLTRDKLIEVAVLVTDSELNVLDPGLDLVISADDADLDGMVEVVTEMHAKSGLTDAVRASTLTVAEAEQQVLAYVKRFVPERRTAPLCGNSIGTDRGFLARDMPELDDHLHYRMIDVSSVKELARRWFPGSTSPSRRRGWPTARWPTSSSRCASSPTTGRRCSSTPRPLGVPGAGGRDPGHRLLRRPVRRRGRRHARTGRVRRLRASGIVGPVPRWTRRPAAVRETWWV